MAIKPADNEAFYREVDEELRRAQLTGFVRRYGMIIGIAAVLLLVVVGGALWWQARKEKEAGQLAETLITALDDVQAGRSRNAAVPLDRSAASDNEGYQAAALLIKADLELKGGNDAAAVALLKQVAGNEEFAAPYRDVALIRQTAAEFDKIPPATVVERLRPLAVKGNPWFGSAGELVAMAHIKQGKPELAAPIFAAMAKDQTVPRSLRSRASQMASSLGIEMPQNNTAVGSAGAVKEASR